MDIYTSKWIFAMDMTRMIFKELNGFGSKLTLIDMLIQWMSGSLSFRECDVILRPPSGESQHLK